jgi:hypothetical protein
MGFDARISKNYALELYFLNFVRKFSDGVTFFELKINLDLYKGDHKPMFEVSLLVLNTIVFEFRVYNTNHVDIG